MKLKRRRLIRVAILPSLFTIGNLLCGFGAITFATHNKFFEAAWMILLALVVFDGLDGLIARATRSVTRFGAQLDSLADIVSFGVAPAFIAYLMIHTSNSHLINYRFTFVICAFYVACAGLRLARFNVESDNDASAHPYFAGLPTPGAGGLVATMIIFNQELIDKPVYNKIVPIALPFAILILAILMISRLRYMHLLNRFTQTRHPFIRLVEIILVGLITAYKPDIMLVMAFLIYALSGPVLTVYLKLSPRHKIVPMVPEKTNADLPH